MKHLNRARAGSVPGPHDVAGCVDYGVGVPAAAGSGGNTGVPSGSTGRTSIRVPVAGDSTAMATEPSSKRPTKVPSSVSVVPGLIHLDGEATLGLHEPVVDEVVLVQGQGGGAFAGRLPHADQHGASGKTSV